MLQHFQLVFSEEPKVWETYEHGRLKILKYIGSSNIYIAIMYEVFACLKGLWKYILVLYIIGDHKSSTYFSIK